MSCPLLECVYVCGVSGGGSGGGSVLVLTL